MSDLPPEFQDVLDAVSAERPEVQALWRYAMVLMMIDDEKAWVIATRVEDGQELIAVRTVVGEPE